MTRYAVVYDTATGLVKSTISADQDSDFNDVKKYFGAGEHAIVVTKSQPIDVATAQSEVAIAVAQIASDTPVDANPAP